MIIRKFEAETENDAIMKAMEELGKNAIVMNIKTIKPKGIFRFFKKTVVEVTAAVDDNASVQGGGKAEEEPSDLSKAVQAALEKGRGNAGFSKQAEEEPPVYATRDVRKEKEDFVFQSPLAPKTETDKTYAIEEKLDSLQKLLEKQMAEQNKEEIEASPAEEKEESEETACLKLIYNQLINSEVAEKYANLLINEIERS